jgi:hypothetical protein
MDGLGHIQYLAKAALSLKSDDALPHVEALIRLAREKGDSTAAERLEGIVRDARRRGLLASSSPTSSSISPSLVALPAKALSEPKYLDEPLPPPTSRPLLDGGIEAAVREYLQRSSNGPLGNILFTGPSGTGKTMTAAWIAARLGRPVYRLAFPQIFDSYLGKTARNLAGAFRETADASGILFLDEVDAVLRARDLGGDHGEMQRTVNVLLLEIDNAQGVLPVFAATNLPSHLDRAVTRRFPLQLHFKLPDQMLRERYIRMALRALPPPYLVPALVRLTEGFSYSHLSHVLARLNYDQLGRPDAWRQLLRTLGQVSPAELTHGLSTFIERSPQSQAREMDSWGIERQVIASVFGVSPALVSRWLAEES